MEGGAYVLICIFFGLAGGIVGKIKGSSFLLWFLIAAVLPGLGLLGAILYRYESDEPRRRCDGCGRIVPVHVTLCTSCGTDLDYPSDDERLPSEAVARGFRTSSP